MWTDGLTKVEVFILYTRIISAFTVIRRTEKFISTKNNPYKKS